MANDDKSTEKTGLPLAVRLGATGAIIAGIGLAIVTLSPSETNDGVEVKESTADIFSMSFADTSDTQKFMLSLEQQGHEPARVYDMNGETVMFSTAFRYRTTTDQILRDYQRSFVDEGLNQEMYLQTPQELANLGTPAAMAKLKRMEEAAMRGELVPRVHTNQKLVIAGGKIEPRGQGSSPEETLTEKIHLLEIYSEKMENAYKFCEGSADVLAQAERRGPTGAAKKIDKAAGESACSDGNGVAGSCDDLRYRFREARKNVDAYRTALSHQPELVDCPPMKAAVMWGQHQHMDGFTRAIRNFRSLEVDKHPEKDAFVATASWSGERFDARAAMPERFGFPEEKSDGADRLPLCPGCDRKFSFAGTSTEKDYSTNHVVSDLSLNQVAEWYIDDLTKKGWGMPESETVVWEARRFDGSANEDHDKRLLRFIRGNDEHLTLRLERLDTGGTRVVGLTAD